MTPDAPSRTRYCSRCLTTFGGDSEKCPNLGCRSTRPNAGWGELLDPGELLDRTYRIHSRLAIGGAGATYLGREVSADNVEMGPQLALKVLYQQRDQGPYLRRLATEAQILQGMNHPHIVECRGFVHRSGHSPYLVTKFESGGSLLDHIRRVGIMSPRATAAVGVQICDALAVAHRQGVIHRDLKPENVLLETVVTKDETPKVRVADFGIAKVFGGPGERLTRVGAFIGTPQYAAPEQFEGVAPEPATDVYAVGALLYFCMTTRPIADFMGELDFEDQREQLLRNLPPRLPGGLGPEGPWMESVLGAAMLPDPGDRCTIDIFAERLHHLAMGRDPGPIPHLLAPVGPPPLPAVNLGPSNTDTISAHPKGQAKSPGWASPAANTDVSLGSASIDESPLPARAPPPISDNPPSLLDDPRSLLDAPRSIVDQARPIIRSDTIGLAPGTDLPGESLHPVPTLERQRTVSSSGKAASTGLGCAAGSILLGLAVAAIAGGAWWYLQQAQAPALTGKESDPKLVAEWRSLAYNLGVEGVKAERACKSPPYLAIEATIRPDGTISTVKLLNYPHAATESCIAGQLGKVRFKRTTGGTVRVAVTMGS